MEAQEDNRDRKNNKNRVRVAIRVRPMINRQSAINQSTCVEYFEQNKIIIGKDRCFGFDHVFNQRTNQAHVYETCVKQLILACFEGYNAAVLAYGQTGSGKTYTMGTGSTELQDEQQAGIIPRVIQQIFNQIELKKQVSKIIIKVSFIQIYNEQIIDLLGANNLIANDHPKNNKHSISKDPSTSPTIRQQKDGSISLVNVVQQTVTDSEQMLALLHKGGCNRSTSCTLMNDCSSRSHGIFAIQIEQHPITQIQDEGFITAKFYFVDLAGSQRAKKTGASGITFREGININLGLLQLGNVISALSIAQKKQNQFITYRNSKLTRILQDSLGGNSNTYMIACISPAESNYQQSLNTIKYATKAMNIKNKPIVNRDPHSAQINALKQRIIELQSQNKNIRKLLSESGISLPQQNMIRNDPRTDILTEQLRRLRLKLAEYDKRVEMLQNELKDNTKRKNQLQISNYELRRDRDKFKLKIEKSKNIKGMKTIVEQQFENEQDYGLVQEYQGKIRQLQSQLFEQQRLNNQLQQQYERIGKQMSKDEQIITKKNRQILRLKSNIKSLLNQQKLRQSEFQSRCSLSQPVEPGIREIYEQNAGIHDDSSHLDNDSVVSESGSEWDRNEQFIQAQADFRASSSAHNEKLSLMECQIRQQQEKLQAMTEEQINLQYQLISQMKEEYHQKIMILQKQKLAMIKQQEQMAGYQKNPKLKQKIQNLQIQLRQLRKKAKQQNNLQKQVAKQNQEIKKLAAEIKVHKVQKIEINRKIKQDRTAYDKFKKERIKQILMAKKQNIKKDKQIRKLTLQNKKKSMQVTKKNEQINKAKKINEAIKSYNKQNKKQLTQSLLYSSRRNKQRRIQTWEQQYSVSKQFVNQHLLGLHSRSLQYIVAQEQIKYEMNKYDKKICELQDQIQKIIDEQARLQLILDKLQITAAYNKFNCMQNSPQPKQDQQHVYSNLQQLKDRVSLIQQNIIYCQQRYNQLGSKLPNFYEQADIIHNTSINSLPKVQAMLILVYQSLRKYIMNGIVQYKNVQTLSAENQQLKQQVQKTRQQLSKTVYEHQINLARLRQEMITKYYTNLEEQHYQSMGSTGSYQITNVNNNSGGNKNSISSSNNNRMDERERKNFQRKIVDLTKTNRQLSADVEMWRRKCSVVQQKYHNINAKMAKDKFIGRPREEEIGNKKGGGGWNIGGVNSVNSVNTAQMLEQVNQMIDKIENKKKGTNMNEEQQIFQINRNSQDVQFSKNKWDCVMTVKASRSPILSMTTHKNLFITSGTKAINIWDQQNCQLVADLSNPNILQGFVKNVIAVPQYQFMAAACQKQVFIWDIRSYDSIAVLKNHKDQVRCLHSHGNLLFSAGKGLANSGSLLVWDLRNLENPIEQKQRNLDIFALTSNQNTLFYGTRNHLVRRMTLEYREVLSPFQPPHMDTVTSLAVYGNYLISGSKDKNLRLWSLDGSANNIRCTTHAFNDYVNTVESDKILHTFYAGSRDGQVKVATIVDEKIKFIGGIIAHTQSVNSVCSVNYQNNGLFMTASTDKTVKFWKPDTSTHDRICGNVTQQF